MMEMSKRPLPDKDEKLYQTTIAASSYIIVRIWNLKQSLGLRPGRKKGQPYKYRNIEIIEMALDALEEKLDRESK